MFSNSLEFSWIISNISQPYQIPQDLHQKSPAWKLPRYSFSDLRRILRYSTNFKRYELVRVIVLGALIADALIQAFNREKVYDLVMVFDHIDIKCTIKTESTRSSIKVYHHAESLRSLVENRQSFIWKYRILSLLSAMNHCQWSYTCQWSYHCQWSYTQPVSHFTL